MISRRTIVSIDKDVFDKIKEAEEIFSKLAEELEQIDEEGSIPYMAEYAKGAWGFISDFLDEYKVHIKGQ